jgi:hypothetical protein
VPGIEHLVYFNSIIANMRNPELLEIEQKIESTKHMIEDLSGVEEDTATRTFFEIADSEWQNFTGLASEVYIRRPDLQEEHFAYLVFVAMQYLTDFRFDNLHELKPETGVDMINNTIDEHRQQIIELCANKNVSTNIVERYAALQIIVNLLPDARKAVDLGTGLGLGLEAINHPDDFNAVDIEDADLVKILHQKTPIELIGIDIKKPDLDEIKWYRACLLPGYKQNRNAFDRVIKRIQQERKANILEGDFTNLNQVSSLLEPNAADVVWTSNALYIVGSTQKVATEKIKPTIEYLAKPGAVWVNSYYRRWKDFDHPDNPYITTVRFVDDWDEAYEVLQSDSSGPGITKDAALKLKKGQDYEKFVEELKTRSIQQNRSHHPLFSARNH